MINSLESANSINSFLEQQNKYEQLNELFKDRDKQEKTILEAREILGTEAESLSDEQVFDLVSEVQFLVDCWLEEYERQVFNGKSLDELLGVEQR